MNATSRCIAGHTTPRAVGQASLGSLNLPLANFSPQMPDNLGHLRHAGRTHRIPLGEQAAAPSPSGLQENIVKGSAIILEFKTSSTVHSFLYCDLGFKQLL
jgi:hypothetical protein